MGVVNLDHFDESVCIGGITSAALFKFKEMASNHGNKKYYQLLLDPNRSVLIEQYAKERGIRVTAAMKEMLYQQIEALMPSKYQQAKGVDEILWKQSVSNRVEGRRQARQHKNLNISAS